VLVRVGGNLARVLVNIQRPHDCTDIPAIKNFLGKVFLLLLFNLGMVPVVN